MGRHSLGARARLLEPKTRRYLYRVGVAVTTALAGYGLVAGEKVLLINLVIAAVLGIAEANVTPRFPPAPPAS